MINNPENNFGVPDDLGGVWENGPEQVRPDAGLPDRTSPDLMPETRSDALAAAREAEAAKRKAALEALHEKYGSGKEKPKAKELSFEQRTDKLNGLMDGYAAEKIKQGFPVAAGWTKKAKDGLLRFMSGRIDMDKYDKTLGIGPNVIEEDKSCVEDAIAWAKEKNKKEFTVNRTLSNKSYDEDALELGQQGEQTAFLMLEKFYGNEIGIFKTSEYDDRKNKADIFLVDKNGDPLAAVDVAVDGSVMRATTREKQAEIRNLDEKGGTTIKYGLVPGETNLEGGNGKMATGSIFNMPLFKLGLTPESVNELAKNFDLKGEKTLFEAKKMDEIVADFYVQIDDLEGTALNESCSKKIKAFEAKLESLRPRAGFKRYDELKLQRQAENDAAMGYRPRRKRSKKK